MGLLNNLIQIPVRQNMTYYENIGYDIPKIKSKNKNYPNKYINDTSKFINVKFEDMKYNSHYTLDWECDGNCGTICHPSISDYHRRNHNSKYYCPKCYARLFNSGKNNYMWKDKSISQKEKDRTIDGYNDFVKTVLKRDNFRCRCCGIKDNNIRLIVHHLNGYNWDVENRINPSNGITLCSKCHDNFHKLYGNGDNTKEQFEEWYNKSLDFLNEFETLPRIPVIVLLEDKKFYYSYKECAKDNGCSESALSSVCNHNEPINSVYGKHFVYYRDYIKMSEEDIRTLLELGQKIKHLDKRVICINTGIIYKNASDAGKNLNLKKYQGIFLVLRHSRNTAYGYKWIRYDEYVNLNQEDKNKILLENKESFYKDSLLMQEYEEIIMKNNMTQLIAI